MPTYTATEQRNIDTVNSMFEGPRELDRATLFADDATWWNGLPLLPSNPGETEHKGINAITAILRGSGRPHAGTGIDSYDVAWNLFSDVLSLPAGSYVVRQHRQPSTTLGGKPYRNVYCFVFRF